MELKADTSFLIVLSGSLGDICRGLFIPAELKRNWPKCRVTWLVDFRFKDLLVDHPYIDKLLVFDRGRSLKGSLDLIRRLRANSFDVVLDLQRILKSGLFSFISRAPVRIGFNSKNSKEFNNLFNTNYIEYQPAGCSKLKQYMLFLKVLGGEAPDQLNFGFEELSLRKLGSALANEIQAASIALVLGSSRPSKDWHFAGYSDLLNRITEDTGRQVLLLGAPSQHLVGERLKFCASSPDLILNLAGKTSLRELAGALKLTAVAVGPDSGPGHVAAAVGTPYIGLFGPMSDPQRVAPYGSEELAIQVPRNCTPCEKRRCPENLSCLAEITGEMVWEKLERVLSKSDRAL